MEQVKLLTHNHPLHRSYQPSRLCSLCRREGWIYDGYRCSECRDFKSHKECAESPPQIESPSHPQHTLKLILMSRDTDNKYCDCCGVELLSGVAYHCSVCDFWVDTSCVRLPPPHDMGLHKAHGHPLAYVKIREIGFTCDVCDQHSNGYHYECKECDCYFHMECADLSQELTHSSHPFHPLKLLTEDEMYDLPNSMCPLCQCELSNRSCFLCKFSICNECAKNPPPLSILSLTTHDHTLTLLPISISFTCNACGMDGYWSPYVCLQCYFVIHIQCVDLPRIININRHDHRISRRYCLEPENPDPMCGKCRRPIDRRYGAYSCSTCPQYAVHSGCATSEDVWDGKELYWKPEEVEDVEPFKMIAHNVIEHFSHKQHHLKLTEDGNGCETSIHCKACIRSVNSGPFYSCMQCDSFLHEKCANLPLKKRHMVFGQQLDLVANVGSDFYRKYCPLCCAFSDGFKYTSDWESFVDVQCIAICEPFEHECHSHPLYYNSSDRGNCVACGAKDRYAMRCVERGCEYSLGYALCFSCAGLPRRVEHEVDVHPLVLCYGENQETEKYWCDVCEKETDPSLWFYTCDDCGLTLHVGCVIGGDFAYLEPGSIVQHDGHRFEVVTNDGVNRPLCRTCRKLCIFSVILKTCDGTDGYVCSEECLSGIF